MIDRTAKDAPRPRREFLYFRFVAQSAFDCLNFRPRIPEKIVNSCDSSWHELAVLLGCADVSKFEIVKESRSVDVTTLKQSRGAEAYEQAPVQAIVRRILDKVPADPSAAAAKMLPAECYTSPEFFE